MRLIDADACIDYIRNNNQHAWEALAYAPTIDAVEVVRCKDCLYRDNSCGMGEHKWCRCLNQTTSPDDYCSYGKRREESEVEE